MRFRHPAKRNYEASGDGQKAKKKAIMEQAMREFEWDEEKAKANLAQHGISFDEAQSVFSDPNHITDSDDRFDYGEERWHTIGLAEECCALLYVAHTIQGNGTEVIRIISARRATPKERRCYGNRKI
jgi:uncharacterized DUF497 family protein